MKLFLVSILFLVSLSAYPQLNLVKDINTGPDSTAGGQPSGFFQWNSYVYFSYWTPQYGQELWRTDGTPEGTTLVKDISPGIESSFPVAFTPAGSYLYFTAGDAAHGNELWRTDGTSQGTVLVADISPGVFSSNPKDFTLMGGNLYFSASTEATGTELWVTNPTTLTAQIVKDINPTGPSGSPGYLTELNGVLYFSANDSAYNQELWRSDGTAAGTWMVKDILPGSTGSSPEYLTKFKGAIYFRIYGDNSQSELWKTDGTAAGTTKVMTTSGYIANFVPTQNYLYFVEFLTGTDANVWKSDGGSSNYTIFQSYDDGYTHKSAPFISGVGGNLFMEHLEESATDPFFRNETFISELFDDNGYLILYDYTFLLVNPFETPYVQTTLIKTPTGDYYLVRNSSSYQLNSSLSKWNGNTFNEVKSFVSGLTTPCLINNKLVFGANQTIYNWNNTELFVSDGTTQGTVELKEVVGELSSSPVGITAIGNKIYFDATENGLSKLFVSDGSPAGTKSVSDSVNFEYYYQMRQLGNTILFSGRTTGRGSELWKTDGTSGGTEIVKDIWPGGYSSDCGNFRGLKGKVIFTAYDPTYGFSLWSSDGTSVGTVMIKDIDPTSNSGGVYDMANDGDSLIYFGCRNNQSGWELWRTDGTSDGTYLVKDIAPGTADAYVRDIIVIKGIAYFSAENSATGTELWRSDGTDAGTYIVKEINTGPAYSEPRELIPFKDGFLFTSYSSSLWYSDGTQAGTTMIKDFPSGFVNGVWKSSYASELVKMGDEIFFLNSGELWKTDGTTAGTQSIIEVYPYNQYNGYPDGLVSRNGVLFFTSSEYDFIGSNVSSFATFWKSNGTAAGTSMITDVINPSGFKTAGNSIFFNATSALGAELWKYTVQNDITVKVNGNVISNNQVIDLGNHSTLEGTVTIPIQITNNGPDNVLLTSSPRFVLSGNDKALFNVTDNNAFGKIISGNTYEASIVLSTSQMGAVSITVDFPSNSISTTSTFQLKATITKQDQTITFGTIASHTMGEDPFLVSSSASSSLPVSFSTSTADKVQLSGNQVTLLAAGKATITASQSGNDSFNAASDVSRTFCINPPKPVITLQNTNGILLTLSSSASTGNQWYKNGIILIGSTGKTLNVDATGVYSVESTVELCTSERSDDFSATITGDIHGQNEGLVMSPNPTADFIRLQLPGQDRKDVVVFFVTGERVASETSYESDLVLNVQSYVSGCYMVRVTAADGVYYGKFIKK